MTYGEAFEAAVAKYQAGTGTASAAKRGRNPVFPYVPIIHHDLNMRACVTGRTEQVLGRAYVTSAEAKAEAQRIIDARVAHFRRQIATRGARALREQYGLPRELPDVTAWTDAKLIERLRERKMPANTVHADVLCGLAADRIAATSALVEVLTAAVLERLGDETHPWQQCPWIMDARDAIEKAGGKF